MAPPDDTGSGDDVSAAIGIEAAMAALQAENAGVVQNGRFMGYTESGQSRANQGIPRFACNPDLNHASKTWGRWLAHLGLIGLADA